MSESGNVKAEASAEESYAKASEVVAPVAPPVKEPAEPAKAEAAAPTTKLAEPEAPAKVEEPAMEIPSVKPKPAAKSAAPSPKPIVKKAKPVAKSPPALKPKVPTLAKSTATKAVTAKAKPKIAPRPALAVKRPAAPIKTPLLASVKPAPVAAKPITVPTPSPITNKTKDTTMSITDKVTGGLETMMTEAQTKAKEAFQKSSAIFGDYATFAKGNVEAVVESGKILAGGLQDMSTNLIAEGRVAFESATADMKVMAAAKSPTDLIQLQSEMMRKSFDSVVAYGSKNTEAMLKIATEAMAPLSSRVSLAVEKVRQVAA